MLYIIRHGKTEWNARMKLQGQSDIPLSSEGRAEAALAASECASINFDICYCSPLKRARETADILLCGREIPIITDDRLKEMGFGVCEGAENGSSIPGSPIEILFSSPEKYIPPEGGESFAELFERTGAFMRDRAILSLAQNKDVLIVGHGAMNLSIINTLKGIPLESFWSVGSKNCELVRLL